MALSGREVQDFAVTIAALLAGRVDGQQAVATTVAQVERIVAEARAAALNEAADRLPALTEGEDRHGTATWRPHDRDVYSLAIEEAQAAIRNLATPP